MGQSMFQLEAVEESRPSAVVARLMRCGVCVWGGGGGGQGRLLLLYILVVDVFSVTYKYRLRNKQTDRQTDRQTSSPSLFFPARC